MIEFPLAYRRPKGRRITVAFQAMGVAAIPAVLHLAVFAGVAQLAEQLFRNHSGKFLTNYWVFVSLRIS